MQAPITTRPFRSDDYPRALELWRGTAGVEISEGDDEAGVAAYLRRNPGLSRVAEAGGKLAGAVLCGHDGRRGLLYHLAVAPEFRNRGVGRRLVQECVAGLRACGIARVILLVDRDNSAGREFWQKLGFEEVEAGILGREVGPD